MNPKLFSDLGLSAEMQKAIARLGFEQAAPIQAEAIPLLLAGHDLVGQSQTGSGKTAAFAVPAIERVDPAVRAVQVLILCPTRELAVQVSEEVHKLACFKRGVHALPIYGGQSYERQFMGLRQGVQIVIGTPGRVMDHMRRGTLRLDAAKMVILDEADVMLNMGFREDIEFILQAVPAQRQTVFFSATMPRPIQELIQKYAREPRNVRIEQKSLTVPTVEQVYYEIDRRYKIELLTRLIDIHDYKLGIIFCNTKRMVDDLVDHLNAQGYSADRLHGDMNQTMRDRVMNKFRKSGLEFLVATDVAARGIDVDDVEVVVNYDVPYDAEDYVHRIGRTGRAGRSGRAITFVAGREVFQIQMIERYTKMRIQRGKVPTLDEVEEARTNVFLSKIRATLQAGEYRRQDHLIERLLEEGFSSTDIASALLHHLQGGEEVPAPAAPARPDAKAWLERSPSAAPPGVAPAAPARPAPAVSPAPPEPPVPVAPAPRKSASTPAPAPAPAAGAGAPVAHESPAPSGAVSPSVPPASPRTASLRAVVDDSVEGSLAPPSRPAPAPRVPRPEAPLRPARPERPAGPDRPARFERPERSERPVRDRDSRPFRAERPVGPGGFPVVVPPRASRRTPEAQTRLHLNVGAELNVAPGDVVGAILGETGLPANVVGTVDVRERHVFVDVASEHANGIIAKLNRTRIKGVKLRAKVA